jgi:predicted GNAT family acetyltransferase
MFPIIASEKLLLDQLTIFDCAVGDAPVCVGRYRTLGQADQSFVTMIDRVGVLPQYRNNGLASYCMNAMMAEISNRPMNNTAVLIMVPENSFLKSKLLGNRGSMYSGVVHEHWNVSPGSVLICLSAAS